LELLLGSVVRCSLAILFLDHCSNLASEPRLPQLLPNLIRICSAFTVFTIPARFTENVVALVRDSGKSRASHYAASLGIVSIHRFTGLCFDGPVEPLDGLA
jgi:hypothetical protein